MNKVFLSGNLTRDTEVRYTQSGKAFARMGIAVRRQFSKDKDAVDFFNLVAWERTAEFCGRYMLKGTRVLVEGRLQTGSYDNKDGVKVNTVDVVVENIEFAGGKRQDDGGSNYSRPANDGGYTKPSDDYSGDNNSRNREPAPPKKDYDDDFGGEPIDPNDTPF